MLESPFQKAYEFEERYGIDRLKLCIEKAEKAYKTYEPETIDYCKCIIETIAKQIIADNNIEYDKEWTLAQLTKKSIDCLNCNNTHIRKALTNIIDTYSTVRNQQGIAAHGHIENGTIPTKMDVKIFASAFFHYLEIIFALMENCKINIQQTQLKFEKRNAIPEYNFRNKYIDNYACINYDPENGLIFINGKEIRPSEILYNLDRISYNELQSAKLVDVMEFGEKEYLEEMILESFIDNPFDDMIDDPKIDVNSYSVSIYDIYFENNYLCTSGTIRWEKIDIGRTSYYSADFKASFTCEYDETIANFNFSIENLEFL